MSQRILSTPCQRAAEAIAALMYHHDITMHDASENGVIDRPEVAALHDQIIAVYRDCLQDDIEIEINLKGVTDYAAAVREALLLQINEVLWDGIDAALWNIQLRNNAEAWVDDAIDRMQAREVA